MPRKIIDLTHTLHEHVPTWTGSCGFLSAIKLDYDQRCRVQNMKMHAGVGTHIDAPAHFIPNAQEVCQLPLKRLVVPLKVIAVEASNDDYKISVEDIVRFEQKHGAIQKGDLVVFNTGWHKRWDNPNAYRNVDEFGGMHFPSISHEAAQLLVDRDVAGIGIDTLSPDCSQVDFPVHDILLGAGKYIVENVTHLDEVVPTGFTAYVLPIKAQTLVEAPVRFVAIQHT